ncbi:MAG: DUF1345 domain-containing protein [Verrucomicrobiota bacterium]
MSVSSKESKSRRIVEYEAHHRVAVASVVGVITFAIAHQWLDLGVNLIVSWDAFALCSLALAWAGILFSDAKKRVEEARLQDSSRTVILCCLVLAAVAGLFGAGMLLSTAKGMKGNGAAWHAVLAVLTVIFSWLLVHTVMTLHYAHVCYQIAGSSQEKLPGVGLDFPDEPQPDFLDFAYFSFIIGMTCQTSDVEITSRRVRRIALFHGLIAFGFNAVIVALSLNLASSLL